jgi:hypothetical protein
VELIDITDLVAYSPYHVAHDLINWLTISVGPVVKYSFPWPATIGCGWEILLVSYRLKLEHPEMKNRSWVLGLEDQTDLILFKITWL